MSIFMATVVLAGCGEEVQTNGGVENQGEEIKKENSDGVESQEKEEVKEENPNETESMPGVIEAETDVQTVLARESVYRYSGESLWISEEYEYDEFGNKIKWTRYYSPKFLEEAKEYEYELALGDIVEMEEYEYDERGNEIKWTYYDSDGRSKGFSYEYDEAGNLIKEDHFENGNGYGYGTEYEYDESGKLIHDTNYRYSNSSDISITGRDSYDYDESGNLIKGTCFDSNGSIISWFEDKYDASGRIIREERFSNWFGGTTSWSECEYDTSGNMIRATNYRSDGSVDHQKEWKYDASGNVIWEKDSDGQKDYEYEYVYDALGNQTKYKEYYHYSGGAGLREGWVQIDREYDMFGNIIKEIHSEEGYSEDIWINDKNQYSSQYLYLYEYNAFGKLIRRSEFWLNENSECYDDLDNETEYEYDIFGNLIKSYYYDKYSYSYDENDTIVRENPEEIREYEYTVIPQ